MPQYLLITSDSCPYCDVAKADLAVRGIEYSTLNLMDAPELGAVLAAVGQKTVPLVLQVIGGSDRLKEHLEAA